MDALPVAVHRQIDQFCIAFEQKLNAGKRPDLAKAVYRQKRAVQGPLLYELLAVEIEWRLTKGESPTALQYLEAFPDHGAVVNAVCTRYLEKPNGETVSFVSPEAETHELLVRCPDCHARISPGKGDLSDEITCSKCGVIFRLASPPSAKTTAGSRLGPFELIKELGSGAFGAVWQARDTRLDRLVAIKIPRRSQLSEEEFEKFMREARAAAQLKHPHIVQVHEVGRLGEVIYIVSDLVDGWSLADWLDGQRLTIREAVEVAVPIADALNHAHECGVIHRDLKPANILMDRTGRPHLTDFGLARRETGEMTITIEGQILGTPAYMSPEQASGNGHLADRRTDVYSFGVLLFELLTGELPFRGSMRVLLRHVIEEEPPSPRRLNSQLPRDLETITLKCLEKNPAKRYATARAVADDLGRFLRREPIEARPIGRVERAWRWGQRNTAIAGSLAAVLLTLVTASVISLAFAWSASQSAAVAKVNEEAATRQKGIAESEAERADERSRYAQEQEGLALKEAARADDRSRYAEKQRAAAESSAAIAEKRLEDLTRSTFNLWLSTIYADLQRNDLRQALLLRDESRFPKRLRDFAWRQASMTAGSDLEGVVVIPQERKPFHSAGNNVFRNTAISRDGKLLAMADQAQRVVIYDWKSKQLLRELLFRDARVLYVTFSSDGGLVAAGDDNGFIAVWDVESGEKLFEYEFQSEARSIAFSPDGVWMAVAASMRQAIRLFRVDDRTFALRTIEAPLPGPMQSLAWSTDSQQLFVGSRDNTNSAFVLDLKSDESKILWRGSVPHDLLNDVALSGDNSILVAAGSSLVRMWQVDEPKQIQSIPMRGVRVAFSRDGDHLAVASDNSVVVYDANAWDVTQRIRLNASAYPFLWFDATGDSLVCGASSGHLCSWAKVPSNRLAVTPLNEGKREFAREALSGGRLLTASSSGPRTLRIRKQEGGETIRTISVSDAGDAERPIAAYELAIDSEANIVFVVCSREVVRAIDLETGQTLWEKKFKIEPYSQWTRIYSCWQFTVQDRSYVAFMVPGFGVPGSNKGAGSEILIFDGRSGQEAGRLDTGPYPIYVLAHAPHRGVIAGRSQRGHMLVWSDSTFEQVASFSCPAMEETIASLSFSPDEKYLVTVDSRGSLNRVDVSDWSVGASNQSLDFAAEQIIHTPSGDTLLMNGGGQIHMFDPLTLESRGRLQLPEGMAVGPIVFNDQGKLLLTQRGSNNLLSWPEISDAQLPSIESLKSE